MTSRTRRLVAAAASTVLLGLGAVACSSSSDDSASDSSPASASRGDMDDALAEGAGGDADGAPLMDAPEAAAPEDVMAAEEYAADAGAQVATTSAAGSGSSTTSQEDEPLAPTSSDGRSLIKEGNVSLSSTDVGRTIFDIRKVLQKTGGEVSDDDTQADAKGKPELSLLTVRVPVDRYDDALEQLKSLGTAGDGVKLISSTSTTQDVSTEVVDTDVRVELQKRSIQRISLLLDRATSIRDIVSIERELAAREADLGSLEKRQKLLADQTARSTITISVERPAKKAAVEKKEKKDDNGFVAGLENGWDAFQDVTTGLLTGAGALLPFAILALVVAVPVRVWMRRRPRRMPVALPAD